eukprot:Plantae.Rhodophyta-Rhodochaete_pulchella.ctg5220.p1 GENE.Plantae.Rhodophyta-Rhodochaete_pulchella.ctg5220~~Plantae.Rhodophyta-Rhodochaete_pulchella.ctg5220.p1  ORF type:complete len:244 (+),score=30.91 Plantae.Rhodophyta-Rhodochaete_pulchella.ctg5220:120-851(+)
MAFAASPTVVVGSRHGVDAAPCTRRTVAASRRLGAANVVAETQGDSPPLDESEVRALLASEDIAKRFSGVNQTRFLEPQVGLELMLEAVSDSNAQIRYAAVSQLALHGQTSPEKTLAVVTELLVSDSESSVRAGAADVIATLGLPECFDILKDVYSASTDWMLKFSIIAGLGELGDTRAYDLLVEALSSEEPLLQLASIGSLGELGDVRAIGLIEPFLESPDSTLKDRATTALELLRGDVNEP